MVQSLEHKGDRVTEIANELSPRVWGNIPLRSCIGLHGGNGRLANPLSIPIAAAGVSEVGGGDIIFGEAGAITGVASADGSQNCTMVDNKMITLGFSNCSCAFAEKRRWAYEVRISSATATSHGIFCGLASAATSGSSIFSLESILTDHNAVDTDASIVGFYKLGGSAVFATMAKNDAAATTVNDFTASAKTVTGGTLVKLGMNSDGSNLRFFVDNVQVGDAVDLDNTNLPIESDLKPVIAVHTDNTTVLNLGFLAFAEAR